MPGGARIVHCGSPRTIARMAESAERPRHTNRLAGETSPYLLQHAHNPVDWFPWGPDALARAKLLDRPIFLSIGYAACHWCHVMERESFEDEATAAALNDRLRGDQGGPRGATRPRPDLHGAVQAMTGSGGWPMSRVPDARRPAVLRRHVLPGQPRHGMPSFRQVLEGVARGVDDAASRGRSRRARGWSARWSSAGHRLRAAGPRRCRRARLLDVGGGAASTPRSTRRNGGWGGAPKFPQPMTIEFLLRRHVAAGDPAVARGRAADASTRWPTAASTTSWAAGSTATRPTRAGSCPHFEQMLYDNAQLARVYAHAWALTGDADLLATIATGGARLHAARADDRRRRVRGEPGRRHRGRGGRRRSSGARPRSATCWATARPLFAAAYGVTDEGNWEGRTILSRVRGDAELGGAVRDRRRRRSPRGWRRRASALLAPARSRGRSRRATTRCSRPGTGSRSRRFAEAARVLAATATRTARRRRYAAAAGRGRRDRSTGCSSPTAGSAVVEGRPGRRRTACSRTTRTSPTGCWRCTRRRSTSAGSTTAGRAGRRRPGAVRRPGRRLLRHGRRRRAARRRGRRTSRTTRRRRATRWRRRVLLRLAALTGEGRYRDGRGAGARDGRRRTSSATRPAFAQWLCALELRARRVDRGGASSAAPDDPATRAPRRDVDRGYRPFRVLAS